jgi:hypothetical protein
MATSDGTKDVRVALPTEMHTAARIRLVQQGIGWEDLVRRLVGQWLDSDVTPEEAALLAAHGFEPRAHWVRPRGIDSSAKYTKREALGHAKAGR